MRKAYDGPPESLEHIVERHRGKPGALLGILEEAQEAQEQKYLSEALLRRVSELSSIPLSRIYSVASFYSFFALKPQGRHTLIVCRGTACHTRGSLELLDAALSQLGLPNDDAEEGDRSTADGLVSVRTVACFGQCALAPVVMCDGKIMSSMNVPRTRILLRSLTRGGKP